MAKTPSKMIELGTPAPSFSLLNTEGCVVELTPQTQAKAFLVAFICNHCPYVIHIAAKMKEVLESFEKKGVAVFAINSNDAVSYPEDSPQKMKEEKARRGYTFDYLFDPTQQVAQSYGATCTPDFFLYSDEQRLIYRGQFDASRPGLEIAVTGESLIQAVDLYLNHGQKVDPQWPSLGCNIKWK